MWDVGRLPSRTQLTGPSHPYNYFEIAHAAGVRRSHCVDQLDASSI